jgi:hypothetical protein
LSGESREGGNSPFLERRRLAAVSADSFAWCGAMRREGCEAHAAAGRRCSKARARQVVIAMHQRHLAKIRCFKIARVALRRINFT